MDFCLFISECFILIRESLVRSDMDSQLRKDFERVERSTKCLMGEIRHLKSHVNTLVNILKLRDQELTSLRRQLGEAHEEYNTMEEAFQASLTQLGEDLKSQTNLCHRLQVDKKELEELHINMIQGMKEDHANMIRELRDGEGDNYVLTDMEIEDWEAEANPQELRDGEGEPFPNEDMDTETEEQGEEEVVVMVEEAGGVQVGANPQEWRGLLFERFGSSFQERERDENRSLTKKRKLEELGWRPFLKETFPGKVACCGQEFFRAAALQHHITKAHKDEWSSKKR